jgi:hypothetical protein
MKGDLTCWYPENLRLSASQSFFLLLSKKARPSRSGRECFGSLILTPYPLLLQLPVHVNEAKIPHLRKARKEFF